MEINTIIFINTKMLILLITEKGAVPTLVDQKNIFRVREKYFPEKISREKIKNRFFIGEIVKRNYFFSFRINFHSVSTSHPAGILIVLSYKCTSSACLPFR